MPVLRDIAAFKDPPDWVCEVVSPSTAVIDRSRKMRIYARAGIGHLWIVDPLLRTLEVYALEDGRWVVASTHGGTGRAAPFEVIELEMARWWLPA
jgi:Uma2 family endonuclease